MTMEEETSQSSKDLNSPHNHTNEERLQRNQGTILFVGNLPFQTPWQHVKDHFKNAGKVRYTDLIADRNGRPKGSALVTMMSVDGAQNAIRMFNETDFEGRRLIVRKFDEGPRPPLVQRDMMPQYHTANTNNTINNNTNGGGAGVNHHHNMNLNSAGNLNSRRGGSFAAPMGGAAPGAYYAGVAAAAAAGGPMVNNGAPYPGRGYGGRPVAPYQIGEPESALSGVPMMDLAGEQVPKPRSKRVPEVGRKLFVSNLPFDCTSYALRETFQQVGNVERAEIIMGRNGKSRGMGIIVMKTEEEAQVAIAEFDGIEMANRAMSVRLDKNS